GGRRSFRRPKPNRWRPPTSPVVVTSGCSAAVGGGASCAAAAAATASEATAATSAPRITRTARLLDDDLPVHPGVRRTDVVVDAGLRERDRFPLALGKDAGIPVAATLPRPR